RASPRPGMMDRVTRAARAPPALRTAFDVQLLRTGVHEPALCVIVVLQCREVMIRHIYESSWFCHVPCPVLRLETHAARGKINPRHRVLPFSGNDVINRDRSRGSVQSEYSRTLRTRESLEHCRASRYPVSVTCGKP